MCRMAIYCVGDAQKQNQVTSKDRYMQGFIQFRNTINPDNTYETLCVHEQLWMIFSLLFPLLWMCFSLGRVVFPHLSDNELEYPLAWFIFCFRVNFSMPGFAVYGCSIGRNTVKQPNGAVLATGFSCSDFSLLCHQKAFGNLFLINNWI